MAEHLNGQLFDTPNSPHIVEQNEQEEDAPIVDQPSEQGATVNPSAQKAKRTRTSRSFPAAPFEEALELPLSIQKFAAGNKIRRLRLFELLERSPDSGSSRQLILNSSRYGLITGNHSADWIELTPEGQIVTSDDVSDRERIRNRFNLAIDKIAPFKKLHEHLQNKRLPPKGVMIDFLKEEGFKEAEISECIDTFLLNAKFVGVLQSLSGAERILPLDHVLDYAPSGIEYQQIPTPNPIRPVVLPITRLDSEPDVLPTNSAYDWEKICFYITPIGSDGSDERKHADLFLGSIIEPALEEFGLTIVRADKISAAGMITRQIIEHIVRARLIIADLSFHNPNVFYELALRHATGLPTVQIMRASDRIPFDVNQVRTITIDNSSIYALLPQLDVHRSAIASQVRRALENPDEIDNPVTAFYPDFKVRMQEQQLLDLSKKSA